MATENGRASNQRTPQDRRAATSGAGGDYGRQERSNYGNQERSGRGRRSADYDQRASRSAGQGARQQRRSQAAQHHGRQASQQRPSSGVRVPLWATLALMVVSAVVSVFVTRAVLLSQVSAANKAAADAQTNVESLTTQVEEMSEQMSGSRSSKSTSKGSASSSDGDSDDDESSSAKKDEGVEDPWVKSGYYTSGDPTLDWEVKKFCDGIADSSMKQEDAALEVYKGIAWSDYVERDDAQNPAGPDWRIEYARKYYEHDCSGNCYEFSAFLSYCMQYLGYTDAKCEGVLIEFPSGWGNHGLVFLTDNDGNECLLDTARGTNGWMLGVNTYNYQVEDLENAKKSD